MMDKKQVLLFIKERLEQVTKMSNAQFSGRITRDEQSLYKEVYRYIDPKGRVCFSCGRSPQIMATSMLNYYEAHKPKRRKKK